MKFIQSFPGVMEHAQHAALALAEVEALESFATAFVYRPGSALDQLVNLIPKPAAARLRRQLARRSVSDELAPYLDTIPAWEIARTLAAIAGASPVTIDRIWDTGAQHFDRQVAKRLRRSASGAVAFEYTALATFQAARSLGLPRVLHLASLENKAFRALEAAERSAWPELRGANDSYFASRFPERQARREAEIALADVVIANSTLTKRSHVAGGADPARIEVVPLGAPPPIEAPTTPGGDGLEVLWSGSFILRKGGHYLIEAWKRLNPGDRARVTVYGEPGLPAALLAQAQTMFDFKGSIPRSRMLQAYEAADVLVFPTLSDGFGLAVTEALSRGVPVIVTDQAGVADLIETGRNGFVVPAGDAEALANALAWCLDHREGLKAMRAEALETARLRQWSHYRQDLVVAIETGLRRAGYAAPFNPGHAA